jgi:hypothetical protein
MPTAALLMSSSEILPMAQRQPACEAFGKTKTSRDLARTACESFNAADGFAGEWLDFRFSLVLQLLSAPPQRPRIVH